ncbi:MAG: CPBP family intramembrane glutamic endopeptidase, partial [Pseudomonadota bacterium]
MLGPIFAAAPLLALVSAAGWLDGLSRTEINLMVALGSLALAPLALWAALWLLHGRPFRSLLSADGRWRWREATLGAAAAICVVGAGLGLGLATGLTEVAAIEDYTPPWVLLATAMLLIPAQATGEELVYRGYLLQEIGARLPYWPAWAMAPAAVFGVLHYDPSATPALAVYGLLYALLFGVFAAAQGRREQADHDPIVHDVKARGERDAARPPHQGGGEDAEEKRV